jgi:hypothetical protein
MFNEEEFRLLAVLTAERRLLTAAADYSHPRLQELQAEIRAEYQRASGRLDDTPIDLENHRLAQLGQICPECGYPFRTVRAAFCAACGWRPDSALPQGSLRSVEHAVLKALFGHMKEHYWSFKFVGDAAILWLPQRSRVHSPVGGEDPLEQIRYFAGHDSHSGFRWCAFAMNDPDAGGELKILLHERGRATSTLIRQRYTLNGSAFETGECEAIGSGPTLFRQ